MLLFEAFVKIAGSSFMNTFDDSLCHYTEPQGFHLNWTISEPQIKQIVADS